VTNPETPRRLSRANPWLRVNAVSKRYGTNPVLVDIQLAFTAGTCTTVVGENGAGKSTLLGILSGLVPPTAGSISIDGESVAFKSPRHARNAGIYLIPQELATLPDLSVAENIVLADVPHGRIHISPRWARKQATRLLDDLELSIDVRRPMRSLSLADRQLVEIAKVLGSKARMIVLDEPTASLHARETAALLQRLQSLKHRGLTLIYVSHHLDECFEVSDHVAVLRDGRLVLSSSTADTSPGEIVSQMLGPDYRPPEPSSALQSSDVHPVVLELHNWSRRVSPALDNVNLTLRGGEILGVFGLLGSGAEAVARGLGGQERGVSGTVTRRGTERPVPTTPEGAKRLGIAYLPAERKTDGLALSQSVGENLTVMTSSRFAAFGFLRRSRQNRAACGLISDYGIRCRGPRQEVGQLSGGNQQKVLLAGRLAANPQILVLHEPTRGVDIGARSQIHSFLRNFAATGAAVLLVTSDVDEAADVPDRLIVLRDGRVVSEFRGATKTASAALATATGGGK